METVSVNVYTVLTVAWGLIAAVLTISATCLSVILWKSSSKFEGSTSQSARLTRLESDHEALVHKLDVFNKRVNREKRKEPKETDEEEIKTGDDVLRAWNRRGGTQAAFPGAEGTQGA